MMSRIWNALFSVGDLKLWALLLGGPPLTGIVCWLIWLVRYGWPIERAQQQLNILGLALFGAMALVAVIVVALAAVKVKLTTAVGSLEADPEDSTPR